jgi:hypothetical protein
MLKQLIPVCQSTLPPVPASTPYCSDIAIILPKLGVIITFLISIELSAPSRVK